MPQGEGRRRQLPLAMDVLRDELDDIEAQLQALARFEDSGERAARRSDLLRALDRYLRLEQEVFHPVLERSGIDYARALASHGQLRAALEEVGRRGNDRDEKGPGGLERVHDALRAHKQVQDQFTFPHVARQLGSELPGLAVELQEVRSRMKGAYGV